MAGITLEINVDDRGTVKIKQFADEAKKAMKEMTDGPKQAQGPLNDLKEGWMAITAKVAVATATFYAAKRMIYDTAKEIASATNEIEKQSRLVGMSTDEWQKWQYAAKMSDVNAQELGIGIKMLSMNMEAAATGTGDANKYFSAMGVSVKTTEGHLRPLNQVMGDIMDKFASWEDGPRKIAISMQLFGRSGETLIPLLNKGRTGFNELAEEARKLGIILSPELVRKGSEAEDIFKKINAQIEIGKLRMAPYALEVAKAISNFLEGMDKIKKWTTDNPMIWNFIAGAIPGGAALSILTQAGQIKKTAEALRAEAMMAWEPGPTPIKKGKPPAPMDFEKYYGSQKSYYESLAKKGEELERGAYGGMEEGGFWQTLKDQKEIQENLHRIEMERAEQLANDMFPAEDKVRAITEEMTRVGEEQRKKLIEIQNLVKDFGWEDYASGAADASDAATRETNRMALAAQYSVSGMGIIWESVGQNISSAWSSNMVNIIRSTESTSEKIKSFFQSIGDVFLSTVSKMITQWLIFGSITGKKEEGGGWLSGGLWSGLLGSILKLQHGGIINRPTPAIIGEAGPEAVIPLKGGKIPIEGGGGDTYVTYIEATDVDSFARRYGPVIESIYYKGKRFNKMSMR